MSQYPNYYPQMNSYGQQYNPQQPYMDRLANLQQYQQNLQMQTPPQQQQFQQMPIGLNGKIVDDFSVLSANDVPMDGNGAVFIKRDGSEVQIRNWAANGTIVTTAYKPILEPNSENGTNTPKMDLNALYENVKALRGEITERFDRLEKSINNSTTKSSGSREPLIK